MKKVVVGIIVKKDPLSYLLVSSKRDFGKFSEYYYPPAGHLKKGENEISALKRELKEELKINLLNAKKITETKGDIENERVSWYFCKVENENFILNQEELKDGGFFTKEEMKKMKLWPATLKFFEKYVW